MLRAEKYTCVICETELKPAPTKDGWFELRYGEGIHYDCIENFYETLQKVKAQRNKANETLPHLQKIQS